MCDKGPVRPLPGGAGQGAWGAGWGTRVGAGGLNNYSICTSCVHHVKTKTYNIAAIGDPVHFYIYVYMYIMIFVHNDRLRAVQTDY